MSALSEIFLKDPLLCTDADDEKIMVEDGHDRGCSVSMPDGVAMMASAA